MTTTQFHTIPTRLDFRALASDVHSAVGVLSGAATSLAERSGIDPGLCEMLKLRSAQLNGCAYCVDLHSRAARRAGVHAQRVDAVVIWPDSDLFTEHERAALHFADQVTLLAETRVPEESVQGVVTAFGEKGAAALLSLLVAAHAWNTIGVTTRCWSTSLKGDA